MLPLSSEHTATSSPETPALPEHASPSSTGLPGDASQHPEGETPRKNSWLRILILILVVGGAVGYVTWRIVQNRTNPVAAPGQGGGGGGRRGGGAGQIVPVSFDVAQLRTIPIQLTALGTVTAYNTVTLKTRVDGQITKVNFVEGQHVNAGQLLIEIDRNPYLAALAQAQGNLTRDEANAALARVQSQRYNQLYEAGVVSKETNQTQQSTAGQAEGTLAADRAAIQAAQVNLNYARVTSPISGIVGLRQVDVGNVVSAASGTGLVVITQVNPIAVIFTLPEDQLPAVFEHMRGGHKLVAEAWDRSNSTKLATGSLLTVDNQIDTTTGTAKLKAVFENKDNALFPNQFVNIHLVLENRPNALVIPAAAIQTGTNGSFVYVIDRTKPQTPAAPAGVARAGAGATPAAGGATAAGGPGAGGGGRGAGGAGGGGRRGGGGALGAPQTNYPVIATPVVIDSNQGTDTIIKSGLTPGQQVVTDGTEKLQDGSRVIPRPSPAMQAARAAGGGGNGAPGNGGPGGPGATGGGHRGGAGSDQSATAPGAGAASTGTGPAGGGHHGQGGAGAGQGTGPGAPGGGGHHHRPDGSQPST